MFEVEWCNVQYIPYKMYRYNYKIYICLQSVHKKGAYIGLKVGSTIGST